MSLNSGLSDRVLVATDGSSTATEAVRWAAALAAQNGATLMLVRVLTPAAASDADAADMVAAGLARLAAEQAGDRGKAFVLIDDDPAQAIARLAVEETADLVVVGSVGMAGRKEFLLGNVPNRVSHLCACSVVIVKTGPDGAATPGHERSASGERPQDKPYVLARARDLLRMVRKHRLDEALRDGLDDPAARREFARRLRAALDEMGPTFAKIGQALSTRADLLPPELIDELATLQEHVEPLTQEQVVGVMESELSVPWEDLFESFEAHPLAAGTIAQVHRATLTGGTRVVVKVQRPTARSDIELDLELLRVFAVKAEKRAGIKQFIDVAGVVDQLSISLLRELDFRREAESITRMREVLQPYPRLGVPQHYPKLSTSRVLVMEEIAGVPLKDVPAGTARTDAGRQLLESYFHQVIGVGFFHADPHPGNLVWRDDRLYFLDFGMVGEIDEETRELLVLLLFALWRSDPALLADAALVLSGSGARVGPGFERELGELLTRYHDAAFADINLGAVLEEMTQTALRYGVRLPASLVLASKALAQMQSAAAGLDPGLDPIAVAGSFVSRLLLRRLGAGLEPGTLVSKLLRFGMRASRLFESLEQDAADRSRLAAEVSGGGVAAMEKTIRQTGRLVAVGLGLAGTMVAGAISLSSRRNGGHGRGPVVRWSSTRRLRGR